MKLEITVWITGHFKEVKHGEKDRAFWESATLNNATYMQYYNRLTELSISMFEWVNLPESVDPRFLELTLFAEGQCVFLRMK